MDMMSDFDNSDVMVRSDNINPIERELVLLKNHLFNMTLSLTYLLGKIFPMKMRLGIRIMEILFLDMGAFWNQ